MTGKTIGYWVATGLVVLIMAVGGIADILLPEPVRVIFESLGYPEYFGRIIGVWKVLGVIALLIPAWPRLKEWAYAGFTFDLTGASISQAASGHGPKDIIVPLVLLAILAVSYHLRPDSRRLPG